MNQESKRYDYTMEYLPYMTCFQTGFLPFLLEHNISANVLFLLGWNFKMMNSDKLYDSLISYHPIDIKDFFAQYMNVIMNETMCKDIIDWNDYLKENQSVVVNIDGFDCPWAKTYQKLHIPHFFYINESNIHNGTLICKDFYVDSNNEYEINLDYLKARAIKCYYLKIGTQEQRNIQDKLLGLLLQGYLEIDIKNEFKKFADAILLCENHIDLFESSDVNVCNIIVKLHEYMGIRKGIAYYFKEVKKNDIDEQLATLFMNLGNKWNCLKVIMIKQFFKEHFDKETLQKIYTRIIELGELEDDMYKLISTIRK